MADFNIEVGIQYNASLTDLQKQINDLFSKVDKPLTLKVNIDGANAVANLKSQIDSMSGSLKAARLGSLSTGMSGVSSSARTASAGLGELTRQVSTYKTGAQTASQVTSTYRDSLTGVTTTVRETADAQGNLQTSNTKVTETFRTAAQAEKEKAAADREAASSAKQAEAAQQKYVTVMEQMRSALEKYSAAEKSVNSSSNEAYAAIQSQRTALQEAFSQYTSGSISLEAFEQAVAGSNTILKTSTATIKENGDAHQTLGQRVGSLASKFSSWLTISQVIMYAVNAMRQMVTASIELDSAMTELKKVTDETDATYASFLENASERAVQIGASLTEVVNATADFARLGYNITDASSLADAANIYMNVGDDLDSIDDASQSIISTMQSFGIEASDAMSIVDKFNAVSNSYAISSGGLGEALQRSAAAMAAANNTLDETIALTTAANTVVDSCHAA